MGNDGLGDKLARAMDDQQSEDLIDEMEERAHAEQAGAQVKPGDPTAEQTDELRRGAE